VYVLSHLRVKWKVKQLEVFQESSLESSSFDDKRLPRVDVVDNSATNRLLRFANAVVDVQFRVPIFAPVN